MAVLQISKIQIRRGRLKETGVPQLASGEFAWAIDNQQLFIGNGSVDEGAPFVGNTQVLTEHDNLLEFIGSYQFGLSSSYAYNSAIPRSIQSKLDDFVSVKDFGAVGDGITDDTDAFNDAFAFLQGLSFPDKNKKIFVPAGIYIIKGPVNVPSKAVLCGETNIGSKIHLSDMGHFNFVSLTERSEDVEFSNIQIHNLNSDGTIPSFDVSIGYKIKFVNVRFTGTYTLSSSVITTAIYANNQSQATISDKITFENCEFLNLSTGVDVVYTVAGNANWSFINCTWKTMQFGIKVAGASTFYKQDRLWEIIDNTFDEVEQRCVLVSNNTLFNVDRSKFYLCGNGPYDDSTIELYPVLSFSTSGSSVTNCVFDRLNLVGLTNAAVTEVENAAVTFANAITTNIYLSDSFAPLMVFSTHNKNIEIDYILKLSNYTRKGKLTIVIDQTLANASINDDYTYSTNETLMEQFQFGVSLSDNDSNTSKETLTLSYYNSTSVGAQGTLVYYVKYM